MLPIKMTVAYFTNHTVEIPQELRDTFPKYDGVTAGIHHEGQAGGKNGTLDFYLVPRSGSELHRVASRPHKGLDDASFEQAALKILNNPDEVRALLEAAASRK